MGKAVGNADEKCCESQPRVERGPLEATIAGAQRHRYRSTLIADGLGAELGAGGFFRRLRAEMRLPDLEFDALDIRPFGPQEPEHKVVIMRPQPISEEARRHRQVGAVFLYALKLDASK